MTHVTYRLTAKDRDQPRNPTLGNRVRATFTFLAPIKLIIAQGPTCLLRWRRGVVVSGVRRTNEVNPRWARLVLGWVTVFGRVYHLGM